MARDQSRIIELQRALKVAKDALECIKHGHGTPHILAEDALDKIYPLEKKTPLQGLLQQERRPRP